MLKFLAGLVIGAVGALYITSAYASELKAIGTWLAASVLGTVL